MALTLTTRARYALRLMLDVAKNGGPEELVSLATASERTGLSRGYLEQLVAGLRSAGLVNSTAGRHGGYRLAKPPREISVAQVIEASLGPICVVECVGHPETCERADDCECRVFYSVINRRLSAMLEEYSLADLLDPRWVESEKHDALGVLPTVEAVRLDESRDTRRTD